MEEFPKPIEEMPDHKQKTPSTADSPGNYQLLPDYSNYILIHHLKDFVKDNLKKAFDMNLPIMKLVAHYSEEELYNLSIQELKNYLLTIKNGTALHKIREDNEKWVKGEFPGVKKEEISLTDVIFGHNLRKQSLMEFIPSYTNDVHVYKQLSFELEDFYNRVSEVSYSAYLQVQRELLIHEKGLSDKILESSLHGIVALQAVRNEQNKIVDFIYVFANKVAHNMLKYKKNNLIGKRLLEVFPGSFKEGLFDLYKKVVEEEESYDIEFYYGHDGFDKWIRQAGVKWQDGLLINTFDITEQKSTESLIKNMNSQLEEKVLERTQELAQSEKRLKEAQQLSKIGNWEYDIESGKIKWSDELFRIYEFDQHKGEPDFLTLKNLFVLPEKLHQIVEKAVKEGIPYDEDLELVTSSGKHKIVQVMGKPDNDSTGKCVRLYGTTIDISERKAAEELIKRNQQLLKIIIDSVPASIAYIGNDYKYQFVNKQYLEWFGFSSDKNHIGKTVEEISGKEVFDRVKNYVDHALKGNKVEYESDFINALGNKRILHVKYIPHTINNEIKGFIVLSLDMTERIESEAKLNEQNKELKKINTDLDNFIYTASHDLKAPVSNLEGLFNTLLGEINMNEELAHIKKLIDTSFDRFRITLKDLTEISKIDREEDKVSEMVNLPGLFEEITFNIQKEISIAEAQIETHFSVSEIQFSRKNIRSILYNLISNALKYRHRERSPLIRISSFTEGDFIVLEVADNGLGLSAGNIKKIFGMFKRAHDHVEGSGIGLYIVKRIIENSGGKIEVKSEEGKGSTFSVYLKNQTILTS